MLAENPSDASIRDFRSYWEWDSEKAPSFPGKKNIPCLAINSK